MFFVVFFFLYGGIYGNRSHAMACIYGREKLEYVHVICMFFVYITCIFAAVVSSHNAE